MCGIAGYFETNALTAADLAQMSDAIKHRGPDGAGARAWGPTALAHRRLAILDLSAQGAQPMTYQDSGLWIAYNGEIYNYVEIRKELESLGYAFRSGSDTEVILAAFDRWDTKAFDRFNGMWALALFDQKKRRMVLSVDRFGVKPLYYLATGDGGLLFASELKAFLAIGRKLELRWDPTGVRTAVATPLGLEASGRTVLKNIRALGGGEYIDARPGTHRTLTWWDTSSHLRSSVPSGFEEQAEEFREILMDATRVRLRSDVPIATSLSGGLDSSAIVGVLKALGADSGQAAFIHAFPGTPHDESFYARKVAEYAGVRAQWVEADPASFSDHIEDWVYNFESIYPGTPDSAWRIYREQKKRGFSVSIDGHGADEYLAGYTQYLPLAQPWWKIGQLREISGPFFSWNQVMSGAVRPLMKNFHGSRCLRLARALRNPALAALEPRFLLGPLYPERPLNIPRGAFENSALNNALYHDFHRRILPRILRNFDLASMANGIEVRMPFLDYRLIAFAFSLPASSKIRGGYTKAILRESAKNLIPEEVRLRKTKIGFNSPIGAWLRGPLRQWASSSLEAESPLDAHLSRKSLQKTFQTGVLAENAHWDTVSRFWQLLTARHWMRQLEARNGVRW